MLEEQFDTTIVWLCLSCGASCSDLGLEGKNEEEIYQVLKNERL